MFVLAIVIAFLRHGPARLSERLLRWLLLLSVGVASVWAGFFHVAFPEVAARSIGWQVSPFQFEIGVADMAIGIAAIVSFWRSLDFKAAVVWNIVAFNFGVAVGHVREALVAGNFAPNNFGVLLLLTVVQMVALPWLLHAVRRAR
jgi:hypothetical protein